MRGISVLYVRSPAIYVFLSGDEITSFLKDTKNPIDPSALILDTLSATPTYSTHVKNDTIYLDGLAIIELAAWLSSQNPNMGVNAFGKRFFAMFEGGDRAFLSETIVAAVRAATNSTNRAVGEDRFFANAQWEQHPAEFAELMLAHVSSRSTNQKPTK